MCGIVAGQGRSQSVESIEKALSTLYRRGPDLSKHMQIENSVFFGFSLLGLASKKTDRLSQPFQSMNGSLTVCVNGEIYNSSLLRDQLQSRGCLFQTESDCEVVLHGLELYGSSFLSQLNGEFAIVAYFRNSKKWLCAVDPVGTKPIKYFLTKDQFLLASSTAALRELGVRIEINAASCLFNFHTACLPIGRSLFANIQTIPPGHYLEIDSEFQASLSQIKYDPNKEDSEAVALGQRNEITDEIQFQISRAVSRRIPIHFKPAVALSSGVDSSLIALLLKQQGADFSCFSIDFPKSEYSERKDIEAFCSRNQLTTSFIELQEADLIQYFPESVINAENLVINPHSCGKLLLNKQIAKEGYRICFTGDGADELFWGYSHFHTNDEFQFLRDSTFIGSQFAQILKFEMREGLLKSNLFTDFLQFNSQPSAQDLYYSYWFNEYGLKILGDSQAANESIEYRYPYVDLNLLSMKSRPGMDRVQNAPSKKILRQVLSAFDPFQSTLSKRPFTAPLMTWAWAPLFEQFVFTNHFKRLGFFDDQKLKEYVYRLQNSHAEPSFKPSSILLSQILSLGILHREICNA